MHSLLAGARRSSTLVTLDISETFKQNHEVGDEQNQTLDNPVGLRGHLRDAVAGHPTLAAIDLRGNHIDAEDATTLLALVTTCNKLTNIQVRRSSDLAKQVDIVCAAQVDRDIDVFDEIVAKSAENKAKSAKGGGKKVPLTLTTSHSSLALLVTCTHIHLHTHTL